MADGYFRQVLIAADQTINALLGGWADETLSSRSWRLSYRYPYRVWRRVIDAIFFWQEGHCHQSYISERERRQLPPELRKEP